MEKVFPRWKCSQRWQKYDFWLSSFRFLSHHCLFRPLFFLIKSKRWRDSKLHLFPFLLVIESNKEWAAAQEFIEYRFLWGREGGNISGDNKMKKENGTFIIRSKRKYVINSWRIQHTVFIRDFIVVAHKQTGTVLSMIFDWLSEREITYLLTIWISPNLVYNFFYLKLSHNLLYQCIWLKISFRFLSFVSFQVK